MKPRRATEPRRAATSRRRAATLALLAALSPLGCGREFFREWANQDVSEAIFEKSRDPRWRIDVFSVDPPWMARYADPYDRDFPPAPPDDYATQALSPVPQWSYNRLIVPVGRDRATWRCSSNSSPSTRPRRGGYGPRRAAAVPRPPDNCPRPPRPPAPAPEAVRAPGGRANAGGLRTPAVPGDPSPGEMQDLSGRRSGRSWPPAAAPGPRPGAAPPGRPARPPHRSRRDPATPRARIPGRPRRN